MKIVVLGAGMVGRAMAIDLASRFETTSIDLNRESLDILEKKAPSVKTIQQDLSKTGSYPELLKQFDLVVTAVPGFMGFKTLKGVIEARKDVVDISFFSEDVLQLDVLAKEKKITAIVDCGVAPGMSNLVLGRYNEEMEIQNFECYVGGLPAVRRKPFEYKAPFSPIDVIEEYTRPARYVENGHTVTKPALSDTEFMDFDELGTLESFNTDGLRSLIFTMSHIPNMKEKTLRYPGHVDLIIALQRSGFFDKNPIPIAGTTISPMEFSSKILFREWKLKPEEEELTIMKVIIQGRQKDKSKTIEYSILDRYDPVSKTSSMARTTGYTCTAAANMLADGLFNKKGIFPPEWIGKDQACFDYIMDYLRKRNVNWKKRIIGE